MATPPTPYIERHPGDLITSEDWNDMQVDVRQDMATQIAAGIAGLKDVDHAKSADQLGGMSLAELTKYILDQAFAQIPKRTGYMQVFCNLKVGVDKIVQHDLKAYPVADVYQLEYFEAVCAKGERTENEMAEWVLFYLYHADERRLRVPPYTGPINIETEPKFRILWKTLLDQFVEQKLMDYTDDTTLDDLEVDFWQAMFKSPPNDDFDPDAYCHSPWFEKCCGEKRTVGDLKKHGDFDDIYLKVRPVKTINLLQDAAKVLQLAEPANVLVSQLNFDNVALRLVAAVDYPAALTNGASAPTITGGAGGAKPPMQPPNDYLGALPVLLLLKA